MISLTLNALLAVAVMLLYENSFKSQFDVTSVKCKVNTEQESSQDRTGQVCHSLEGIICTTWQEVPRAPPIFGLDIRQCLLCAPP